MHQVLIGFESPVEDGLDDLELLPGTGKKSDSRATGRPSSEFRITAYG